MSMNKSSDIQQYNSIGVSRVGKLGAILAGIGVLVTLPFLLHSWGSYIPNWLVIASQSLGLLLLVIGVSLIYWSKAPEKFNLKVFIVCAILFFIVGSVYWGFGKAAGDAGLEGLGLFFALQGVLYMVLWIKVGLALRKGIEKSFRKNLFYPVVIFIAALIALIPGYSELFKHVGNAFMALLLFTQAKDIWEIELK